MGYIFDFFFTRDLTEHQRKEIERQMDAKLAELSEESRNILLDAWIDFELKGINFEWLEAPDDKSSLG